MQRRLSEAEVDGGWSCPVVAALPIGSSSRYAEQFGKARGLLRATRRLAQDITPSAGVEIVSEKLPPDFRLKQTHSSDARSSGAVDRRCPNRVGRNSRTVAGEGGLCTCAIVEVNGRALPATGRNSSTVSMPKACSSPSIMHHKRCLTTPPSMYAVASPMQTESRSLLRIHCACLAWSSNLVALGKCFCLHHEDHCHRANRAGSVCRVLRNADKPRASGRKATFQAPPHLLQTVLSFS